MNQTLKKKIFQSKNFLNRQKEEVVYELKLNLKSLKMHMLNRMERTERKSLLIYPGELLPNAHNVFAA